MPDFKPGFAGRLRRAAADGLTQESVTDAAAQTVAQLNDED
ncbi:MAG: hypothetical protein ACLSWY_10295 [Ruthenibacterium lactatiformans]